MNRALEGKVALVTGAASGIGRASAFALAREGARVVVADRNVQGGNETARKIAEGMEAAIFIEADVSIVADVERMVRETVKVYGRLDCAFNNAGLNGTAAGAHGKTHEITEAGWDQLMATNLKAVWLCMKYEILQMLKQGGGSIINASSVLGLVGGQGTAAYAASKHGVIGLTKSAALDYATQNIRINAICPGWTDTAMASSESSDPEYRRNKLAMQPIGRIGHPEEVAQAVVWLCSDAASFVIGHAMCVDGGWTVQ